MDPSELQPGPAPQLGQDAFAARRARIAAELEDEEVLVVATHEEALYSHDVNHRFRPQNDFWYLTGFAEPGAVMTLDAAGRYDLWMRTRDPKAEVWHGRRLGLERAELLSVDRAHDVKDLSTLTSYLRNQHVLARTSHHAPIHELVSNLGGHEEAQPMLARHRMIKDANEQALLTKAADVGADALREALPLARPGAGEYVVEGALLGHYRKAGSTGPGYPPIVGAGANATILHYIENNRPIGAGDLVLVDAGCEWGYYNSDITRTVPADGEFTTAQADVYEAVYDAQVAALAKVRPGNRFKDPHDAAVEVLVDRLVDMGHLVGDKEKLLSDQAHRPFYMHGTSHFLGLDVHDAGVYKDEDGEGTKLQPGMCLTVEPGLYYNPDFAKVPGSHAGLGVRLENDVLVTDDGHNDLLAGLPASLDDILALMA